MENKPNILWICTDQQRYDSLGCYGNPFVNTPNIDALANNGVMFDHAYCQSPVCTPSRASFLTGRYPRTCRVRSNGQEIPADEVLLPKILRDKANYISGLSGKLHLSACSTDYCRTEERRIDDGYEVFRWAHNVRRTREGYPTGNQYRNWLDGLGIEYKTSPSKHLDSPGDVNDRLRGSEYWRGSPLVETGMPEEFHLTKWCTDRAIDFIKDRQQDHRPWLFSVNFYDPHHPMDPPEAYLERYIPILDEIPLPAFLEGELENKPLFQHDPIECQYHFGRMSPKDHRLVKAAYWAMIDLIDVQMGRMIQTLKETDQLNNTLIIYMSDHGELLGDHSIYLKGPYFYEPAVRVPLIFSMPGTVLRGIKCSALVELIDVPETIISAAGLKRPDQMQGKSVWPILTGQTDMKSHKESAYCEYYNALGNHNNPKAYATMSRNDRYKIVRYHGINQGELYDLATDPEEFRNCWDDPEYVQVKIEMLNALCDRMAFTIDPLPLRLAGF